MQMNYKIRLATESDLAFLLTLDHRALHDEGRAVTIRKGTESKKCWVADVDGKPIGYGLWKENFFGFDFIELIYVENTARRQGIGSALLMHLESECRTPKVFTSTNESNSGMRRLLARLGYDQCGMISKIDEGDPELIFVKHLTCNCRD